MAGAYRPLLCCDQGEAQAGIVRRGRGRRSKPEGAKRRSRFDAKHASAGAEGNRPNPVEVRMTMNKPELEPTVGEAMKPIPNPPVHPGAMVIPTRCRTLCNEVPSMERIHNSRGESFQVECASCGARGPVMPTEAEAAAGWNARPAGNALVEDTVHDAIKAAYRAGAEDMLQTWAEVCECAPLPQHADIGETSHTYWNDNRKTILAALSRTPSQANDAAGQGEVDTRVLAEAAMAKARDEYHELYGAELKRLREAVQDAARWFMEYATGHSAAGKTDKAMRDIERAKRMRAALSPTDQGEGA